jgi:hypothetical protein
MKIANLKIKRLSGLFIFGAAVLTSCQTAQPARELKLIGFDENVSKGKNMGPVEGADCVYQVLGYWLGGQPTLQRAFMNARKGKVSSLADAGGGGEGVGGELRYMNNAVVSTDGFNAGIFGKKCINVTATGFK